jgi:hypothetical protein
MISSRAPRSVFILSRLEFLKAVTGFGETCYEDCASEGHFEVALYSFP